MCPPVACMTASLVHRPTPFSVTRTENGVGLGMRLHDCIFSMTYINLTHDPPLYCSGKTKLPGYSVLLTTTFQLVLQKYSLNSLKFILLLLLLL